MWLTLVWVLCFFVAAWARPQPNVRSEAMKGLSQLFNQVATLWETKEAFQPVPSPTTVREAAAGTSCGCTKFVTIALLVLSFASGCARVCRVSQRAVMEKLLWIPGHLLRVYSCIEDTFLRYKVVQMIDKLILPTYAAGMCASPRVPPSQ